MVLVGSFSFLGFENSQYELETHISDTLRATPVGLCTLDAVEHSG